MLDRRDAREGCNLDPLGTVCGSAATFRPNFVDSSTMAFISSGVYWVADGVPFGEDPASGHDLDHIRTVFDLGTGMVARHASGPSASVLYEPSSKPGL